MDKIIKHKIETMAYPLLKPKERISVWRKARGIWKNRKPDPTKELEKMCREWGK